MEICWCTFEKWYFNYIEILFCITYLNTYVGSVVDLFRKLPFVHTVQHTNVPVQGNIPIALDTRGVWGGEYQKTLFWNYCRCVLDFVSCESFPNMPLLPDLLELIPTSKISFQQPNF